MISKETLKKYAGAINVIFLTYFAQMIFGTLVGVALSENWPEMPYAWGLMAIFTYWGGHGAATTAGTLFEQMGNEGMLSLGIATVSSDVVNGLALQLAIVLLCMFVGEHLFKSLAKVPIPAFASVIHNYVSVNKMDEARLV